MSLIQSRGIKGEANPMDNPLSIPWTDNLYFAYIPNKTKIQKVNLS